MTTITTQLRRAAVAVALLAAGCGSGGGSNSATPSDGQTDVPAPSVADAPTESSEIEVAAPDLRGWAETVANELDRYWLANAEVVDDYLANLGGSTEDRVRNEAALLEASAAAQRAMRDAFPAEPPDAGLTQAYADFVASITTFVQQNEASAEALLGDVDAIVADEQAFLDGGGHPGDYVPELFNGHVGPAFAAFEDVQGACLVLADLVVDRAGVAINCLGLAGESEPEADGGGVRLGNLNVGVTVDEGLEVVVVGPGRVRIQADDNDEFGVDLIVDPVFADPAGDLRLLQVVDGMPWPDDIEAWLDALGATVTASGTTTIAGLDAEYWEFLGTEEAVLALTGTEPAVAIMAPDGGGADVVQLIAGVKIRMMRIDAFGAELLGVSGAVDDDAPFADELPSSLPVFSEVMDWLDEIARQITVM